MLDGTSNYIAAGALTGLHDGAIFPQGRIIELGDRGGWLCSLVGPGRVGMNSTKGQLELYGSTVVQVGLNGSTVLSSAGWGGMIGHHFRCQQAAAEAKNGTAWKWQCRAWARMQQ